MAIMTYAKKLAEVRENYRDTSSAFTKYKQRILRSIELSGEITAHITEWVAERDIRDDNVVRTLDRLTREYKIYISRLRHLEYALKKCRLTIQRSANIVSTSKNSKIRQEKLADCTASLLQWYHLQKDFKECYRQAMGDWRKSEETILALE